MAALLIYIIYKSQGSISNSQLNFCLILGLLGDALLAYVIAQYMKGNLLIF